MKRIILTLSVLSIICCKNEEKLNKYDLDSINKFIVQCIKRNDSVKFLKLFGYDNQSENFVSQAKKLSVKNLNEIHKIFKGKKVEILANDNIGLNYNQFIDRNSYNLYVKKDKEYYRLRFANHNKLNGNSFQVFYFHNLNEDCEKFASNLFKPEASVFKHYFAWSLENNQINSVIGKFTNFSDIDITSLKFRLTAYKDEYIIFNKTFLVDTDIKKGDVGTVTVEDIEYFSTIKLTKNDNIKWEYELLGIFPKPSINPCNKIKFLETQF